MAGGILSVLMIYDKVDHLFNRPIVPASIFIIGTISYPISLPCSIIYGLTRKI